MNSSMLAIAMTTTLHTFSFSQGRVATQPLRSVAITLYLGVFATELIYRSYAFCGEVNVWVDMGVMAGVLLILVGFEWYEQRYFVGKPALAVAIGVLVARTAFAEVLGGFTCSGFHKFLALVPPLLAYLYIGRRAAYITSLIHIWLFYLWNGPFSNAQFEDDNVFIEFFIFLVGIAFVVVIGRVLTLAEANRQKAERLVVELEQSQMQVAELAKVDERNRIARDIHDSVGHHLTAVNILLEKAIAFRPINAEEADEALRDAKRSAKAALSDVRDSVRALRETETQFDLSSALHSLVDSFGSVQISLTFEGDETPYVKSTLMALYRVAQEGLTNIEKHAGATSAELAIMLNPDHATLQLKDNGVGIDIATLEAKSARTDAHFGLTGLRERLELLGGTLTVSSEPQKGTTLRVFVPARGLT